MADKKYSVILEKVGNQPLKTTKILCGELGLGLAKAKGLVDKVPSTIATDLESAKALEMKKKLEEVGNTVSIPGLKIEAEPTAKKNVKSSAVSSDDAFAAIFGGSTTPKTTTVKKQSTSGTTPKTTVAKAEPKKTTSKAPAASSDSFDSLFGGAAPKKETKTQPKSTASKTMRKEYSNGSYEGEMKDGEPHGFGTYRWNDGDIYTGEYVNGVRHGKGKLVFASGNYYDGEWQNGQRHGKGKWTYADGRYYTGVWENGESVSSTSIVYPSASKATPKATKSKSRIQYEHSYYEGETKDDEPHGKGVYVWDNGTRYEGDFFEGNITGNGVCYYANGNRFDGCWKNGIKNGEGALYEYDATKKCIRYKYVGLWTNGKREGIFERYVYDEGNTYNLSSYIIYKNDEEKRRYIARAMQDKGITTKEDVLRYHKEQTSPKAKTATSSDSDNEAVWEEFEYVEDLIEKLKTPELFDDPEDRWIANAYQYFEVFMSDVAANYYDTDFATASEIFANILDLDVNGLQDYLTEKLGYIGDHCYVDYIETCLNYACLHVTKDALIPFANLCYFRTKEIGINYMGLYVKAYSRYYYANGVDVLWFERYACNGDGEYPLAKEDDPSRHEAKYGDKLDELLNNGYRMGSDCRLYLP